MSWLGSNKLTNTASTTGSPSTQTASDDMTITRALVELKTLDKRIQKSIDESVFCSIQGELRKPDPKTTNAQSNYDKIRDLMNRRIKIKSAIVSSNASTRIKVCGMDMSVAEAIELKSSIKNYKTLLMRMKQQYGDSTLRVEQENQRTRTNLENSLSKIDNGNSNGNSSERLNVGDYSKSYMKIHGVEVYDPIKIEEKITSLEKFINDYESEVDFVLSEKNATTKLSL